MKPGEEVPCRVWGLWIDWDFCGKIRLKGKQGARITANTITLYRGANDTDWNYVRVRKWRIKTLTLLFQSVFDFNLQLLFYKAKMLLH